MLEDGNIVGTSSPKDFIAGVAEGIIQDGLIGTSQGVWGVVQGVGSYLEFVYLSYTADPEYVLQHSKMAQHLDSAGVALENARPFLEAFLKDLPALVTGQGEVSEETLTMFSAANATAVEIMAAISQELAAMTPQERERLKGRIIGAIIFEAALIGGTGGLAIAAKTGKLKLKVPGVSKKLVDKINNALVRLSKRLDTPRSGFGANGLYRAPTGMADDAVKAAYLEEVDSLAFRVKLGLHNRLTPFHKRTSVAAVREAVENGAFGRGPFTVRALEDGTKLFGGSGSRTFLNRQFFHHELIHVSQMIKNPNLWSKAPLRMLHEPIQIWTAHATWGIPATILTGWWILESTDGD